jgi:hypothetical protein
MIHFKREGDFFKLGLNLYRAPGGFVAVWAWYNFAKHEATTWRFRLRMHIKPRILWSVERFDVVEEYMRLWGCEMINSEVLQDLKAVEEQQKRTNVPYAYIKP